MRKVLYPNDDDRLLAQAIHVIDRAAQQEGFRFDGWEGFTEDVNRFIDEHGAGNERP
jgi:hypothetical protein